MERQQEQRYQALLYHRGTEVKVGKPITAAEVSKQLSYATRLNAGKQFKKDGLWFVPTEGKK